jgi:hypothetical protein
MKRKDDLRKKFPCADRNDSTLRFLHGWRSLFPDGSIKANSGAGGKSTQGRLHFGRPASNCILILASGSSTIGLEKMVPLHVR